MTVVMVTGVGAIIGYGILRSLRARRPDVTRVGIDLHGDAVGEAWCDRFLRAPATSDAGYIPWLRAATADHAVDLLIPGIEQDVHRIHDTPPAARPACAIVQNSAGLTELARDKWALDRALLGVADDVRIETALAGSFDELAARLGLPFLLKPRRSYASKGQVRITDRQGFQRHADRLGDEMLAQRLVGHDDEEYTVGVFGDGQGGVCAAIALRRRLATDGSTGKAWVADPPGLDRTVRRLCALFRPLGPTNLQFRRDGDAWKLLEINPRISSSTSIRAAFGYDEATMCLDYYLDGRLPVQPAIRAGFARRYLADHVVYGGAGSELAPDEVDRPSLGLQEDVSEIQPDQPDGGEDRSERE